LNTRFRTFFSQPKPRAIARVFLFFLVLIGSAFLVGSIVSVLTLRVQEQVVSDYISPAATLLAFALAHFVMLRMDKKPWSAVGLGRGDARPRVLALGFVTGICAIGLPSALLIASSQLQIMPAREGSSLSAAGLAIVMLLPAAFYEELAMRGYPFMAIREAFGWKAALIVTSTVFGLLHMANPNVDAESVLLVILAGFFLGAILLATGSLFAAGMAHFGWNWAMAALMHTNVSGVAVPSPDFRTVDTGPDWLTGGAWGPEGGLAAGVGMFVAFIYLYARRIRRLES
jgi:uncharacterized protein